MPKENAVVGELIKGKTTTMRERHSGERKFFTSKSADLMQLRSHNIHLTFDNRKKDVFLNEKNSITGTEARFIISKNTKRKLTDIFSRFAPEEYDFSKGERGKFYHPETQLDLPVYLEPDIAEIIQKHSTEKNTDIQTKIGSTSSEIDH